MRDKTIIGNKDGTYLKIDCLHYSEAKTYFDFNNMP